MCRSRACPEPSSVRSDRRYRCRACKVQAPRMSALPQATPNTATTEPRTKGLTPSSAQKARYARIIFDVPAAVNAANPSRKQALAHSGKRQSPSLRSVHICESALLHRERLEMCDMQISERRTKTLRQPALCPWATRYEGHGADLICQPAGSPRTFDAGAPIRRQPLPPSPPESP